LDGIELCFSRLRSDCLILCFNKIKISLYKYFDDLELTSMFFPKIEILLSMKGNRCFYVLYNII
jgi:hypothetical protein